MVSATRPEARTLLPGADAFEEASDATSYQSVGFYRPHTIVVRIEGSYVKEGIDSRRVSRSLSDMVAQSSKKVDVFFDLLGFQRYDSQVRALYTEALRGHGDWVERIIVRADSRLVRMGATVASMVLTQLRIVSPPEFERLLRASLHR